SGIRVNKAVYFAQRDKNIRIFKSVDILNNDKVILCSLKEINYFIQMTIQYGCLVIIGRFYLNILQRDTLERQPKARDIELMQYRTEEYYREPEGHQIEPIT